MVLAMGSHRTGSQKLTQANRSKSTSVDGSERYFTDFYHHLLTSSWPFLLFQIVCALAFANLLFALGYYFGGGVENARPGHFDDLFFFSVETMATIGYGKLSPVGLVANVLMSVEALFGMISLALMTGLIFSKFSRPTARVRFSRIAVVTPRDGVPSLMFRMANVRANQIVEAHIHVVFARQEVTAEGEDIRRFHDLTLARYRNAIFAYSWTAIHPIQPGSPFYGADLAALTASRAEVIVSLTGTDETFAQTIYARHSYDAADIVWGAKFVDILTRTPTGEVVFDYSHFDEVEPVAPAASTGASA
ncbi:MAG TPA: ion channel [Candidatus Binataceae bacterium]|nr:ion channel [Candidatus Binataceae bacterium]